MPASSAMRASLTLSGQLPDQRSATMVTARPDEQLAPKRPILSALPLYMAVRSCMEAVGASTDPSHHQEFITLEARAQVASSNIACCRGDPCGRHSRNQRSEVSNQDERKVYGDLITDS